MGIHHFKIGDDVIIHNGSHADIPGTIVRISPGPHGGEDKILVRIHSDADTTVFVWPGQIRKLQP